MAAAIFTAMWLAMMIAMMLPSSIPMLMTFRSAAIRRAEAHVPALMWTMAAAYFVVWTAFGVVAYLAGVAIAAGAMQSVWISRSIPLSAGVALVAAGIYQLTPWKTACLSHCRHPLFLLAQHANRKGWRGAVALGLHHGFVCTGCCWALMLMQLVLGVMNLAAMIAVATVIAVEKLTPYGPTFARAVGAASIAGGIWLIARGATAI